MILRNNKIVCFLCSGSVICRTSSVKRHFETVYKTLLSKSTDEQKSHIARALSNKNVQINTLVKFVKFSISLISASFGVAKSIAVRGKPFSDDDFIKTTLLDCA